MTTALAIYFHFPEMVYAPQQHATECAQLDGSTECHLLIPLLELIPDSGAQKLKW